MHSSAIYMGNTQSTFKKVDNWAADPATFKAGMCGHLKSDGTVSLASADGSKIGISLGRSLSGPGLKRTAFVREGEMVPILLTSSFTPVVGAQVQISTTTGLAVSSGTAVNAFYRTSTLVAYDEDGTEIAYGAAYIDFPGGL